MTGQQEYRITDEELQQISEIDYGNCDVARRVVLHVRSRPVQASQDSNLNEQEREIKNLRHSLGFYKERCDELQKWQSKMRDPEREIVCQILANGFVIEALFPKPTDEQCQICEQAIRKDATGKVLEQLDDLRRYANGEYKEADLSDNEHDLRIHLEYENRIWGIMQELRKSNPGCHE